MNDETKSPSPGGTADDTPDETLLRAVAGGDRSAFAVLFGRFAGRIKAFLIRTGAQPDEAEEIAQDVMVTIWRKATQFNPDRAGAATWIFTIARNRRIDRLRRAQRPDPDPADPILQPEPDQGAEVGLAAADRDTAVRAALEELGPDQLEVVRLAFYTDLSHGEIATKLDLPLGTVKSRLRLAFGRLRTALGPDFSMELHDD